MEIVDFQLIWREYSRESVKKEQLVNSKSSQMGRRRRPRTGIL
jgi:hypothetical protein